MRDDQLSFERATHGLKKALRLHILQEVAVRARSNAGGEILA